MDFSVLRIAGTPGVTLRDRHGSRSVRSRTRACPRIGLRTGPVPARVAAPPSGPLTAGWKAEAFSPGTGPRGAARTPAPPLRRAEGASGTDARPPGAGRPGRPRPVSAEPSAGSVGAVARPGRRSPEGAGPGRLPGMSFERDAGRVEIYTDGACKGNPGPGGWGVLLRWGPHEKELYGGEAETTNNRMELTAAIVALESLTRRVPVVLHTDSTYVRDGITRWVHGWKRNGWRTSGK